MAWAGLCSIIVTFPSHTHSTYGPRRDKTCQTSLLSYTDYLEIRNFACSKPRYNTFQKANNIGADQTARMRRLVCACVIRNTSKTGFLALRPNNGSNRESKDLESIQSSTKPDPGHNTGK